MNIYIAVSAYFIFANTVAFFLFATDKERAVNGGWRVSEARLLFWAAIGGWMGAKLAQRYYRHKTRKQPFADELNCAGALQLLVAIILVGLSFTPLGQSAAKSAQAIWDVAIMFQFRHEPEQKQRPRVVRLVEW